MTPWPIFYEEMANLNVLLIAWFQRKMLLLCMAEDLALYTELLEDQGVLDLMGDGTKRKKTHLPQCFSLPESKRSFK